MDNEYVSSSEISVISNDAFRDTALQSCEVRKYHSEKCSARDEDDVQSVVDLKNIHATRTETLRDENDVYEQLLTNIKRAEDHLTDVVSITDCEKELTSDLRNRAQRLHSEMMYLREELIKETALWEKEKEEFHFLREQCATLAFEEATAAARAAAAAYAIESPLSNDLNSTVDVISEQSIKELAMLEYEKDLAKYQDSYSFDQAEQRYNMYKQALTNAYKQRLLKVERLCDEELERIRQSTSYLQPLKEIVSQWSMNQHDHGDSSNNCNCQLNTEQFKTIDSNFDKNDCRIYEKVNNEVSAVSEILSARFKREDT